MYLGLARKLGLPAARSQVLHFEDEVAIVVERYDRRRHAAGIRRLHQEDLCQAPGLPPTKKYQGVSEKPLSGLWNPWSLIRFLEARNASNRARWNFSGLPQNEGGSGVGAMLEVIRTHSGELREDVRTFVRACTFNWLIGGADAHAQSFSMLIGAGGRNRLAPLYDVASALVYDFDVKKLKLAIEIGGKYLLDEIGLR